MPFSPEPEQSGSASTTAADRIPLLPPVPELVSLEGSASSAAGRATALAVVRGEDGQPFSHKTNKSYKFTGCVGGPIQPRPKALIDTRMLTLPPAVPRLELPSMKLYTPLATLASMSLGNSSIPSALALASTAGGVRPKTPIIPQLISTIEDLYPQPLGPPPPYGGVKVPPPHPPSRSAFSEEPTASAAHSGRTGADTKEAVIVPWNLAVS